MSRSALANLTAQYTDSENEEDQQADDSSDSDNSQASQVIIPSKPVTPVQTPEKKAVSNTKTRKSGGSKRKKALRLVSYQDDTIISDDEGNADESSEESTTDSDAEDETFGTAGTSNNSNSTRDRVKHMDVDDLNAAAESGSSVAGNARSSAQSAKPEKSEKYAHYGFSLPPEPKGKPSQELVEKIRNLYDKMETNNMDMNRIIQERKEFRNPSIYEKLIQFCDINEFGTNYPPEMYDPLKWGSESYYEELARVQKNEMLKRQKERKDTDKVEQATALARKVEEEAKKRKSKWDQPAPVKAVVAPALTTTVTGTKGTVISAFGSLPKKPAV